MLGELQDCRWSSVWRLPVVSCLNRIRSAHTLASARPALRPSHPPPPLGIPFIPARPLVSFTLLRTHDADADAAVPRLRSTASEGKAVDAQRAAIAPQWRRIKVTTDRLRGMRPRTETEAATEIVPAAVDTELRLQHLLPRRPRWRLHPPRSASIGPITIRHSSNNLDPPAKTTRHSGHRPAYRLWTFS